MFQVSCLLVSSLILVLKYSIVQSIRFTSIILVLGNWLSLTLFINFALGMSAARLSVNAT